MRTKCTYPDCTSGSAADRRYNKSHGLKNKTLFRVPKDSVRSEQWKNALGRSTALSHSEVVCELHFNETDILRTYDTNLPDTSKVTMDRGRISLLHTAIPIPVRSSKVAGGQSTCCETNSDDDTEAARAAQTVNTDTLPINASIDLPSNIMLTPSTDVEVCAFQAALVNTEPDPPMDIDNIAEEAIATTVSTEILKGFEKLKCPDGWAFVHVTDYLAMAHWNPDGSLLKHFIVHPDFSVTAYIRNRKANVPGIINIQSAQDILYNINVMQPLLLCNGMGDEYGHSEYCLGFTESKVRVKFGHIRCASCYAAKRRISRKKRYSEKKRVRLESKYEKKKNRLKAEREKAKRMRFKINSLKGEVLRAKRKCAAACKEMLDREISKLDPEQQETVRACFDAANCSNKGRRYTRQWIYECLLMRIKSRKLYEHMRSHNILALPHVDTLNKYIKKMGSAYGLNESTFHCLKKKSDQLDPAERRGTLLLDEMKLAEGTRFDRDTYQFHGFVNLGDHTPVHQEKEAGDHALVLMFQPFRGKWVQVIACFLSKGCATSSVLACLILECITLLEKSGFCCDAVTTDGAQWNRSMWRRFGITETNISCQHPCDSERRLWFCSDFPHLIKNMRNSIVETHEIWTPDGVVKKKHWQALLDVEQANAYNLKVAYKLTADHLQPKYYQKMNVPMAFQLFSDRVAAAMHLYHSEHPDLKDSGTTAAFVRRVNKLIVAMMSRTPSGALKFNSPERDSIVEFLEFLHEWEIETTKNDYKFLTDNTCFGLKITLRATLEILEFLAFEHNYEYIMTTRLNQDALEMFRLMSTYSLVKPCKGSNVTGGEMLSSLLTMENIDERKDEKEFLQILDSIIENRQPDGDSTTAEETPRFILTHVAGYVARKAKKWTKCVECLENLRTTDGNGKKNHEMIDLISRGYLTYPSQNLLNMIETVEKAILGIMSERQLQADTFFQISYALQEIYLPLVGCAEHDKNLSKRVLSFYLIMRADFLSKAYNKENRLLKEKTRKARKSAKL